MQALGIIPHQSETTIAPTAENPTQAPLTGLIPWTALMIVINMPIPRPHFSLGTLKADNTDAPLGLEKSLIILLG